MNMAAARKDGPDLSVIVPVYNAADHLPKLVEQVFGLERSGLRCQMICLDDASTDSSVAVLRDLAQQHPSLEILMQANNRGAGNARNDAWPLASGRYTIFFDADDTLHGEVLIDAIGAMDAEPEVDVAIFAYRYEREKAASFTDMNYEDKKTLEHLLQGGKIAIGSIENMAGLLTFTNYPWNKLLRTEHYKREGMRFGSTKVNNDILGHWHSVLLARSIMVCRAVNCTHVVHPRGYNLTNSFGVDRLTMFDALEETYSFLESRPDQCRHFAHQFWVLTDRLVQWARPRIVPALLRQFDARYTDLLVGRLDVGDLARMRTKYSADLADSIVNHLIR